MNRSKISIMFFCLFVLCIVSCNDSGNSDGIKTITIDPPFEEGDHVVSGTVYLPDEITPGKRIWFMVYRTNGPAYIHISLDFKTTKAKEVKYRILGVNDGYFRITLLIDENENEMYGDPGDFRGSYDGTLEAPILDENFAAYVLVAGDNAAYADFGIGLVP